MKPELKVIFTSIFLGTIIAITGIVLIDRGLLATGITMIILGILGMFIGPYINK